LETLLSTNLVKRQQELQAQLAQSDTQTIMQDVDLRKQELKEAKITVDETVRQLKCMYQSHCDCVYLILLHFAPVCSMSLSSVVYLSVMWTSSRLHMFILGSYRTASGQSGEKVAFSMVECLCLKNNTCLCSCLVT